MTLDEARKHFTRYEDANAFFEEYEAAQEKYALEKFQQKTLENTMPSMVRDAFKEFDDYVKYYAPQLYERYVAAEFIVGRTELLREFFPNDQDE